MSQCIVPNWNSRKQRQEDIHEGSQDQRNNMRSSQVLQHQSPQNLSYIVPMSINYELGDNYKQPLVPLHGHGAIHKFPPHTKPLWNSTSTNDTLESIVHQATLSTSTQPQNRHSVSVPAWVVDNSKTAMSSHMPQVEQNDHGVKIGFMGDFYGGKRVEDSGSGSAGKRIRSEPEKLCGKIGFHVEQRGSRGEGARAMICKENMGAAMRSWDSFESAPSLKTPRNLVNEYCSDEDFGIKGESSQSQYSGKRSRSAVVHNQSERRRRDRINEKMKALQKLVPNANKTDKASMLDEVITYLKQLQAQVQMLTNARTIPQMLMPLGMQQQLQMSLLGRMGMGIADVDNWSVTCPSRSSHLLFAVPSPVPAPTQLKTNINAAEINSSIPDFSGSYGSFLAQQSMNMDFFNKMATLYQQQAIQPSKKRDSFPRQNNAR